ncbi:hypothetical protein JOC25_002498 [Solibacillus kalamii]|uniref:Lipoprotein n=1 Tax=Solibacillus kalamii TaxID=1748298 RepID=A0ABX3ZGI4_9BACL|nr:hypothetical protein [Solibacillus kalamii]MBM7666005.1 hypothetical protein [Solibacillus kalamii]OUZ38510.1 hypothetical protein CBM15_12205 [Solibacillus kalamii]
MRCSDHDDSSLNAEKEDFENVYYESGRYKISLQDNILMIIGTYDPLDKNYVFDNILFSEGAKSGDHIEKEYKNVIVKTKGDTYYITADDLELTFEKFAAHIITDEDGNEFIKKEIVH